MRYKLDSWLYKQKLIYKPYNKKKYDENVRLGITLCPVIK